MVQVGDGQHLGRVLQTEGEHLAVEPLAVGVIFLQVVDTLFAFAESRDQHPAGSLHGAPRDLHARIGVGAEAGGQQRGLLAGGQVCHEQVVRVAVHVEAHVHVLPLGVACHVAILLVSAPQYLQAVTGSLCVVWGREVALVGMHAIEIGVLGHAVAAAGTGGDIFQPARQAAECADDLAVSQVPGEQTPTGPGLAFLLAGHEAPGAAIVRRGATTHADMGGIGPALLHFGRHVGHLFRTIGAVGGKIDGQAKDFHALTVVVQVIQHARIMGIPLRFGISLDVFQLSQVLTGPRIEDVPFAVVGAQQCGTIVGVEGLLGGMRCVARMFGVRLGLPGEAHHAAVPGGVFGGHTGGRAWRGGHGTHVGAGCERRCAAQDRGAEWAGTRKIGPRGGCRIEACIDGWCG